MDIYQWIQLLLIAILFAWILLRLTYPIKRLEQYKVDELYDTMNCADKVLSKHKVPYFMICGTLLGSVRDGGMIPWDDDIDLAILTEDLHQIHDLKPEFEKIGMTITFDDYIWRLKKKNSNVWLDIFPFVKDGDMYVHEDELNRSRFPKEKFTYEEVFPLTRRQFGPLSLPAPRKAETVLARMYGDNWQTPISTQGHKDYLLSLANFTGRDITGMYTAAQPAINLTC